MFFIPNFTQGWTMKYPDSRLSQDASWSVNGSSPEQTNSVPRLLFGCPTFLLGSNVSPIARQAFLKALIMAIL